MSANSTPSDSPSQHHLPGSQEDPLRRFLRGVILIGVVFNIISWGGAAAFLALRHSGISLNWAGGLPDIQLGGPRVRETIPADATLPPTPIDITSVGRPTDIQLLPTITATSPAESTPGDEVDTPSAPSTPQ